MKEQPIAERSDETKYGYAKDLPTMKDAEQLLEDVQKFGTGNVLPMKIEELKEKQEVFGEVITKLEDYKERLIVKNYRDVIIPSQLDNDRFDQDGNKV